MLYFIDIILFLINGGHYKIMKQPRHSSSIQKHIILLTISCLLGMCIIICCTSFYFFQNYLQHSLILSTEANLQLLSDNMNNQMDDIYQLVRFCQTNSEIASYIEQEKEPFKTYDRITEEYNNNPSNSYIPRLAIITEDDFLQIVSPSYSTTDDLSSSIPTLPFFQELMTAPTYDFSSGFISDPFYKNSKLVLPIIRPISYPFSSQQGGYLYMEVSSDLFLSLLSRYTLSDDSNIYLVIGTHTYLYQNNNFTEVYTEYQSTKEISDSAISGSIQLQKAKLQDGKTVYLVTLPLDMSGCYICQSISHVAFFHQLILLLHILGVMFLGIIGIGIVLVVILNKMIHVPVAKIRKKMLQIAQGDFSRDYSIEWNHELGDIGRGINDLSENVDLLLHKRLEDEKQKRDLEYKMLQSQINPHFIYNTLGSIKWMADMQGSNGISEITTALSRLLKSISKGTSLIIPILEELHLIENYFTIQRYRYGGTITMEILVDDPSIYECDIIKFTLQPLVENAIFHGIEPKGTTGKISIHAFFQKNNIQNKPDICIQITDDGVGMSAEKASRILSKTQETSADFFKEIGIANVQKRLQYEFGAPYGITIESQLGTYTTMSIHLPQRSHTVTLQKEESHV